MPSPRRSARLPLTARGLGCARAGLGSIVAILTLALTAAPALAVKEHQKWFVKAGGAEVGTGARAAPFATLAQAEEASWPGDRIVVMRSPEPLDGSIALAADQKLIGAGPPVRRRIGAKRSPRITNTSADTNSGDAVVLADGATVRNLVFDDVQRGAIYGRNVDGVRIRGNVISRHNLSCAKGLFIPPFEVPATVPGPTVPIPDGLDNGWAAIMVDADSGEGKVAIIHNRVLGAQCGDGIDLRMSGTAEYRATVRKNAVADLRQGEGFESVLAFGMQTKEESSLMARLDRNSQTNLGNSEDLGVGPEGANTEGVFIDVVGPSTMEVRVSRNTYTNPNGLGGFSGNGLEYVAMGDGSRSNVVVEDSSFSRPPGDVIEEISLGTNAHMNLRLENVVATDSLGLGGSGSGNTFVIGGNNADCLVAASADEGNVIETTVRGGDYSRCANNGITAYSAGASGAGPESTLAMDITGATITGNQGANLRVLNQTDIDRLSLRVEGTDLSDATGAGSGNANVSFEEQGSTAESTIDLGGGELGSTGGNCLDGGSLAAFVNGFSVTAVGNWWGQPGGPRTGSTVVPAGDLTTEPSLSAPPQGC